MNHLGARLSGYVDGELPPATLELVEAHLDQCPECRDEVEAELRLKKSLGDLAQPEPSARLLGDLLDIAGPGGIPAPVVRTPPGLRPAVPGKPSPDPGVAARRRSMAAASLVSVAAVTLGASLFGGEPTTPRQDTSDTRDVSDMAVRHTPARGNPGAAVSAGALPGGWTFGLPSGLAAYRDAAGTPFGQFLDFAYGEADAPAVLAEMRPFYVGFLPQGGAGRSVLVGGAR